MMESPTPSIEIFGPQWVCHVKVHDAQKADSLFVFVQLSSSEIIDDVAIRVATAYEPGRL
jgi:hypothetical protein